MAFLRATGSAGIGPRPLAWVNGYNIPEPKRGVISVNPPHGLYLRRGVRYLDVHRDCQNSETKCSWEVRRLRRRKSRGVIASLQAAGFAGVTPRPLAWAEELRPFGPSPRANGARTVRPSDRLTASQADKISFP